MKSSGVSETRNALRPAPTKGQRATLPPDEPDRAFRTVIWSVDLDPERSQDKSRCYEGDCDKW